MYQFLLGFLFGIYLGTYHDCKPLLDNILKNVEMYLPSKKNT